MINKSMAEATQGKKWGDGGGRGEVTGARRERKRGGRGYFLRLIRYDSIRCDMSRGEIDRWSKRLKGGNVCVGEKEREKNGGGGGLFIEADRQFIYQSDREYKGLIGNVAKRPTLPHIYHQTGTRALLFLRLLAGIVTAHAFLHNVKRML